MTLIFDMEVTRPDFAANLAFYRRATAERFTSLAGGNSYSMYGFQTDETTLVGSYNEGTSGVIGNMAWTNIGLRTGDGWYASNGRMLQAGMKGFGMINNSGVSGYVGTVAPHSGNSVAGSQFLTIHVVFRALSAGEGGAGTIIFKENAYRLRISAANTLIFEVWDGAAWRGSDTGANVVYGYWHHLTIKFDGTLAAADRIKMWLNGRDVTVSGANIPSALVDDLAAILYVLDNAANNAAWNGSLGLLMIQPNVAYTIAQAQSLIELKGMSQATPANQPTIPPGQPQYYLDNANKRMVSYQFPFWDNSQFSLITWISTPTAASGDDVYRWIYSVSTAVQADMRFFFGRSGLAWGHSIQDRDAGGLDRTSENVNSYANGNGFLYASIGDGTNLIIYRDGVFVASNPSGPLTGNWRSNEFWFGYDPNALGGASGCRSYKMLYYNRALSQLDLQKIQYNGLDASGQPRWYPRA